MHLGVNSRILWQQGLCARASITGVGRESLPQAHPEAEAGRCLCVRRQEGTDHRPGELEQFPVAEYFAPCAAAAALAKFERRPRGSVRQVLPSENEILVRAACNERLSEVEHFEERVGNGGAVRRPPAVRRGIAVGHGEQLHGGPAQFAGPRARLRIADRYFGFGALRKLAVLAESLALQGHIPKLDPMQRTNLRAKLLHSRQRHTKGVGPCGCFFGWRPSAVRLG